MENVYEELGIPSEWQDEFESWGVEFEENTGSTGDMVYDYYFYVPEQADPDFLAEMNWSVGECLTVSVNAFDTPDDL